MAEIDTNAIDELKNTLGQNPDKYQAWQTFGQKYINDPEAFSKAKIVVGAHVEGLTNMMFAPRNSLLIEIMNEVSNKNPMGYCEGFRKICSCNGRNYMRLVCPVDADSPQTIEQNPRITCAPDRLMKLVEAAEGELGL